MFKNYIKLAVRNLLKHKTYSILNILGLAVGAACCLLILIYVMNEFSYDQHFLNAKRIYRLNVEYTIGGKVDRYANVPRPIAPNMFRDFPEVAQFTRLLKHNRLTDNPVLLSDVATKGRDIQEDLVFYADSSYFEVFDHEFIIGNPENALNAPQTVVVTEKIARALFQDPLNAIDKQISIDASDPFRITGIIADPRENSHMDFEVLISWATFHTERDLSRWLGGHVFSYLLFTKDHDITAFHDKWPAFYEKYMKSTFDRLNGSCQLYSQKLTDIHLRSNLQWEVTENGNIIYVYVFLAVGLFILIIACINYMNMATARSSARATEVGVRKVFGADRRLLRRQFLIESASFTICALFLAVVAIAFLLPEFKALTDTSISTNLYTHAWLLPALIGMGVFVSLVSGLYPAFYLAKFQPAQILQVRKNSSGSRSNLRGILVITQFAISIVIIAATGIVREQLAFTRNKNLGFDKESTLVITLRETVDANLIPSVKSELLQNPNILAAATSYDLPGKDLNHTSMEILTDEGEWQQQTFQFMQVDPDFIDMMKMQIIDGRQFDISRSTDKTQAVIINESAVRKFGLQDAVGKTARWVGDNTDLHIIGVINDFHIGSLHSEIEPIVMLLSEQEGGKLYLKIRQENFSETLAFLKKQWQKYDPVFPLDYVFLDQNFYLQHETEQQLAEIFSYFALLAIFIACLGLIGLTSFTTQQRTKEIGIRKVIGATMTNVVLLIWKEFFWMVMLANLVAWPVAYFAMEYWLADFAYRTAIGWQPFVFAGLATLIVSLLVVSYQSTKAALANPVEALRYE